MAKLIEQNDIATETFIELISNNPIVVYEDIQGSPIYAQWTGEEVLIKPRKLSNDTLTDIDLAIQKYYGPCYDFFNSLSDNTKSLLPKNWWFEFEYFFDNNPAHVKYDVMPDNGLVLTSIIKGKKRTWNIQEITEYANLLDVSAVPIIFNGELTDDQLKLIKYYLNTSEKDLNFIFDENNFAHFFYKVLNPASTSSALMKYGNFQDNIERIILKIPSHKKELSIAILNPLYKQHADNDSEKTDFLDTYSIILLNFLEYSQLMHLDELDLKSKTRSDLYLELISYLFNYWMQHTTDSFEHFEFAVPSFFKEDKFKVNSAKIKNTATNKYIENDEKKEYAFRCVLGSFQYPRKKTIGIFNDTSLNLFNDMVHKISARVDEELQMRRDKQLRNSDLLNFNDYADVQYSEDGAGEIYPDVYSKAEELGGESKKKGKNAIIMPTKKKI